MRERVDRVRPGCRFRAPEGRSGSPAPTSTLGSELAALAGLTLAGARGRNPAPHDRHRPRKANSLATSTDPASANALAWKRATTYAVAQHFRSRSTSQHHRLTTAKPARPECSAKLERPAVTCTCGSPVLARRQFVVAFQSRQQQVQGGDQMPPVLPSPGRPNLMQHLSAP